jgi:hypothetical protein
MKTIIQFMALGSLLFASPLLAWGPNIHNSMDGKVLDHDSIKPYLPLFGLNKESIIEEATEPMPAEKYQWISWRTIQNEGKGHSGFLNNPDFTCLSLTQFAGYVLHDCSDCGVPLGHSPANELLDNKLLEAILALEGAQTWRQPSGVSRSATFPLTPRPAL